MAEAAAPERQLKRALSAFDLTCIGIGAIIGTGIFALAGTAAAGEQAHAVGSIWKTPVLNFVQSWTTHAPLVFGRPGAGPAVMLSFVVAGIAVRIRGALLRRTRRDDSGLGLGLHVFVCDAG